MLPCLNFHILGLFGKFEISRKMVKNQRLTPFLIGEIFRPEKLSEILVYSLRNMGKTMLLGLNFHIFSLFRKFEIGRKNVKNQRLTPLLIGEIFPPQKLPQILV